MRQKAQYGMMKEIERRWSPRAYDKTRAMDEETLLGLLEAASFAPSAFNEQPWRFIVARTEEERAKFLPLFVPQNAVWAQNASAYVLLLSRQTTVEGNRPNRYHQFDAGTAFGLMAVEAEHRGLICHPMAGFDPRKAREVYGFGEEYLPLVAIALGWYGDKESLPEDLKKREEPNPRRALEDLIIGR